MTGSIDAIEHHRQDAKQFLVNEYRVLKGLENKDLLPDAWSDDLHLLKSLQFLGNEVLAQLDNGTFRVIPGDITDAERFIGRLWFKRITKWKFLEWIEHPFICSQEEGRYMSRPRKFLNRHLLWQNLPVIPTCIEVFQSLWKNESDSTTYSDIASKLSHEMSQMNFRNSSLMKSPHEQ